MQMHLPEWAYQSVLLWADSSTHSQAGAHGRTHACRDEHCEAAVEDEEDPTVEHLVQCPHYWLQVAIVCQHY